MSEVNNNNEAPVNGEILEALPNTFFRVELEEAVRSLGISPEKCEYTEFAFLLVIK